MKAEMTGWLRGYEAHIVSGLVLLESFILLWMSFTPGTVIETYSFLYFNSATIGHLMAYMVYGCLLGRFFGLKNESLQSRDLTLLAIVIGATFGLLNEIIQSSVPGRSMSSLDVLVNLAGAAAGGWLSTRIRKP